MLAGRAVPGRRRDANAGQAIRFFASGGFAAK